MRDERPPRYGVQLLLSLLVALLLVLGAGGIATAALRSAATCGGYSTTQSTTQGDG
ncbi:hypothetical protein [Geodermatophilus sp. URMC 64]